jgi:hypothetical protein
MNLQTRPVHASNDCKFLLTYLPYLCLICDRFAVGKRAMPINPSTEHGVFGPEATAAMGEAFDAACKELGCTSQPEVVRELVATLIIAAASYGELDPIRLRMVASAGFAISRPGGLPAFATTSTAS